jgi:hypothetical protein
MDLRLSHEGGSPCIRARAFFAGVTGGRTDAA